MMKLYLICISLIDSIMISYMIYRCVYVLATGGVRLLLNLLLRIIIISSSSIITIIIIIIIMIIIDSYSLIDPDWQEELERRLVGVLAKPALERLI